MDAGQILEIEGRRIEILKTLADCIGTFLYFRTHGTGRSLTPRALWPPEITRSMSAGGGEIMEAQFDPVLPSRTEVKIAFGRFGADPSAGSPVTIPVDRGRTARFERRLGDPYPDVAETDGVTIAVADAKVGVLHGRIDLLLTSRDDSILAVEFGWPHRVFRQAGPGVAALWSDWRPRESVVRPATTTRGGMTTVSIGSRMSLRATTRRTGPAQPARERRYPPEPPQPVQLLTVPEGYPLTEVSAQSRSWRLDPSLEMSAEVSHGVPEPASSGVELVVSGLYLCRFAGGRMITVPNPKADSIVDLTGAAFEDGDDRVELIRWEPGPDGSGTLVVRAPSPWWWPDVRIFHDEQSVSLWMRPGVDGTAVGALPRMYAAAFEDPRGVRLALRMLGRPAPEIRIPIALTPSNA